MAEVYWDLEWTLQQQGFDYAYDKRLYDRLREGHARPVREHFWAGLDYQTSWPASWRTTTSRGRRRPSRRKSIEAAAVITFLSPGLRFFHQGQFEGRRKRISPHLGRGPCEPVDPKLRQFYERLLAVLPARRCATASGNCSNAPRLGRQLDQGIASWPSPGKAAGGERLLVAVNYAPNQSQCHVRLPFADLAGSQWRLQDQMGSAIYERDGNDLRPTACSSTCRPGKPPSSR